MRTLTVRTVVKKLTARFTVSSFALHVTRARPLRLGEYELVGRVRLEIVRGPIGPIPDFDGGDFSFTFRGRVPRDVRRDVERDAPVVVTMPLPDVIIVGCAYCIVDARRVVGQSVGAWVRTRA